jgi:hypothetical protein
MEQEGIHMTITPPKDSEASRAFQYVPVPVEHLPAVFKLLANLSAGTVPAVSVENESDLPESVETKFRAAEEVWTVELLSRLATSNFESTQALAEIMDVIATEPGWYTQVELAVKTGRELGQYRIIWSKLSPHFAKHYGNDRWPIVGVGGIYLNPPKDSSLIHFGMSEELIRRWRRSSRHL